jgi:hypothetical protein
LRDLLECGYQFDEQDDWLRLRLFWWWLELNLLLNHLTNKQKAPPYFAGNDRAIETTIPSAARGIS